MIGQSKSEVFCCTCMPQNVCSRHNFLMLFLVCSDIGRGSSLYDTPNYESGAVSKFLPVPLAGMFGSAQISSVNKKAALYELASAIGVVRPLTDGSTGSQTVDTASELKQ